MKIMYTVVFCCCCKTCSWLCFVVVVKLVVHVVESTQTMTSLYMYNEPRTVSLKGKEFMCFVVVVKHVVGCVLLLLL